MIKSYFECFCFKNKDIIINCKNELMGYIPHGNAHKQMNWFRDYGIKDFDYIDYIMTKNKNMRYY